GESTDTVAIFLDTYMENVKETLRPSTARGYEQMHALVKPHLDGVKLRDFHTPEADELLERICAEKKRAHTTHRNLKNFLSGAFRFPKRKGLVTENPVRDAAIPRGKPAGNTHAY